MNWKPTDDVDEHVRQWMKAKGWEVNRRPEYDSDREICAWFHEPRGGKSMTLRISRKVLEDYPAFAVLYHLDTLRVAAAIKARPGANLVVVQKGQRVTLEERQPMTHANSKITIETGSTTSRIKVLDHPHV